MLKSIRLVNFFSFGDCTIELEPDLNVLVGINGSGKSNFLRAFQLLKAGLDGRLQEQIAQWGGMGAIRAKNRTRLVSHHKTGLLFKFPNSKSQFSEDGYKGDITYCIFLLYGSNGDFRVDETVIRDDKKIYFDSLAGNIIFVEQAVNKDEAEKDTRRPIGNGKELTMPKVAENEIFSGIWSLYYELISLDLYRLFNTTEDAPMRTTVRATGVDKLLPNGDNMFQVLKPPD